MKRRILVVGDLMLDVRRYGTSTRTSPEDPRCRVLNLADTVYELGGAGNVARWLAAQPDVEVELLCHCGRR
jgi:bifunctional ADP-heptose synthase (sugar kinase/adenylyltransferase)